MRSLNWLKNLGSRPARRRKPINIIPAAIENLELRVLLSSVTGTEQLVNTTGDGTQQVDTEGGRSAAAASDGSAVVVWSSTTEADSNIFAQRLTSDGSKVGAEIAVNTTSTGNQANAAVAMNADGSFIAAWQSAGHDGLNGSLNGSLSGVYAQRFDSSGIKSGNEFQVNMTTTGNQQLPAVTTLSDGSFAIAWTGKGPDNSLGVFARAFDADGVAKTGEISVNLSTELAQTSPSIAADESGGFAVVWQGSTGGDRKQISFRHFDAFGTPISTEVVISESTSGIQSNPSIARTTDGNFVVAWAGKGKGVGNNDGIFARRINANGTALSGDIPINSMTFGKQFTPSIVSTVGNGFAVVWAHQPDPSVQNFDIAFRRFNGFNVAQDTDLIINSTLAGRQWNPTIVATGGGFRIVWSGKGIDDVFGVLTNKVIKRKQNDSRYAQWLNMRYRL